MWLQMSFFQKCLRIGRNPGRIFLHLAHLADCRSVRKIVRGGEIFHEYEGTLYPDYLNHGNAMEHIRDRALEFCSGHGLDIGADQWPLPGAVPVREEPGCNAFSLDQFPDGSLDFVFSSHCLEHLDRWEDALSLWITKLKPGGVLFLYLPHEKMRLWKPGGPWSWTAHKWQPRMGVLVPFLIGSGLEIVNSEDGPDEYWSFWIAAKKPC